MLLPRMPRHYSLIGEGHSAIEMKIPVPANRNASPFYKR